MLGIVKSARNKYNIWMERHGGDTSSAVGIDGASRAGLSAAPMAVNAMDQDMNEETQRNLQNEAIKKSIAQQQKANKRRALEAAGEVLDRQNAKRKQNKKDRQEASAVRKALKRDDGYGLGETGFDRPSIPTLAERAKQQNSSANGSQFLQPQDTSSISSNMSPWENNSSPADEQFNNTYPKLTNGPENNYYQKDEYNKKVQGIEKNIDNSDVDNVNAPYFKKKGGFGGDNLGIQDYKRKEEKDTGNRNIYTMNRTERKNSRAGMKDWIKSEIKAGQISTKRNPNGTILDTEYGRISTGKYSKIQADQNLTQEEADAEQKQINQDEIDIKNQKIEVSKNRRNRRLIEQKADIEKEKKRLADAKQKQIEYDNKRRLAKAKYEKEDDSRQRIKDKQVARIARKRRYL